MSMLERCGYFYFAVFSWFNVSLENNTILVSQLIPVIKRVFTHFADKPIWGLNKVICKLC